MHLVGEKSEQDHEKIRSLQSHWVWRLFYFANLQWIL